MRKERAVPESSIFCKERVEAQRVFDKVMIELRREEN